MPCIVHPVHFGDVIYDGKPRYWREWIVQVRILFTLQLARYIVLCQSSWCITDYPFCWYTCVFSLFLLCPCCPNLDCHGRLLQLWSELSVDILVSYEHCFLERDAKVRQQTSKVVFEKDGSESVLIESGRHGLQSLRLPTSHRDAADGEHTTKCSCSSG